MTNYQWWISQFPRILISTVAILLDCFFRKMKSRRRAPIPCEATAKGLQDRVMVQVLLWLTASLPSNSDLSNLQIKAFLHSIFFANLMAIIAPLLMAVAPTTGSIISEETIADGPIRRYGALGRCCPQPQSFRNETSWSMPTANNGTSQKRNLSKNLESLLIRVPPSLWVALLLCYLETGLHGDLEEMEPTLRYVAAAGGTLVLISVFSWCVQFYQARAQQRRQQNFNFTMPTTIRRIEERNWQKWTVPQVVDWLSETLDGVQEEDLKDLTSRLAWEGVDGAALDCLDMDALRHMDVPYGIACRLLELVKARLTRRYPRPQAYDSSPGDNEHGNHQSSLGEYSNTRADTDFQFSSLEQRAAPHARQAFLDEEELEQARSSMMQRFGFHLPELPKGRNSSDTPPSGTENMQPKKDNSERQSSTRSTDSHEATTNDALLATMPSHIRDIAQGKPQLWQQAQTMNAQEKAKLESKRTPHQTSHQVASGPPSNLESTSTLQAEAPPPPSGNEASPTSIPAAMLQNLPPKVREVAERNPELFWKMLNSKQQRPQQLSMPTQAASMPIAEETADVLEQESDEMEQLLPRPPDRLRHRPGF